MGQKELSADPFAPVAWPLELINLGNTNFTCYPCQNEVSFEFKPALHEGLSRCKH